MLTSVRNFVAAGTAIATLTCFSNFAMAQDKLVISTATPPLHMRTLTMTRFAEELERRSAGVLKVDIFDSSQLYNARDVGKAVARGDVGMATVPSPYLSRIEANINVLDLPMLNGLSEEKRSALLDGPLGQKLNDLISAKMDIVVPGKWPTLGRVMYWSTSKPLTTFEDLRGMQIRIPGGAAPAARVEAMGGVPVVMPNSDTALALQQGIVDATMGTIEAVVQQKLTDVGVSHGFWDQGIVGFLIPVVSRKYWSSLSAEQQALFTQVWNEGVEAQRIEIFQLDEEYRAALAKQGVKISDASTAAAEFVGDEMMLMQAGLVETLGISDDVMALAKAAVK